MTIRLPQHFKQDRLRLEGYNFHPEKIAPAQDMEDFKMAISGSCLLLVHFIIMR